VDLTSVLKDVPVGEWIALSTNQQVVGTGKTPEEAAAAAKANGEPMPFVPKVPPATAWILLMGVAAA
jgi:hypothetical protein